jgi:histidine triad (HIT) family protein
VFYLIITCVVECAFCEIVSSRGAPVVFEDADFLAFLDHRPLFPGHCLLIPKQHVATLVDLPPSLAAPLLANTNLLIAAIEEALAAEGTFVAVNNRVSQSVPHLHVHVVPRKRGDGLRGFFWPRRKYASTEEEETVRAQLAAAVARRRASPKR